MNTENEYRTKDVTQMPSEELIKFSFSFRAGGHRHTLTAEKVKDKCCVTIGDKRHIVPLDFMWQIEDFIKQHKLYEWSGFRESSSAHQYICESFYLDVEFEGNPQKNNNGHWLDCFSHLAPDSTNIYAEGSSAFPRGFWEVKREIYNLFDSVKLKREKRAGRGWCFWRRKDRKE